MISVDKATSYVINIQGQRLTLTEEELELLYQAVMEALGKQENIFTLPEVPYVPPIPAMPFPERDSVHYPYDPIINPYIRD